MNRKDVFVLDFGKSAGCCDERRKWQRDCGVEPLEEQLAAPPAGSGSGNAAATGRAGLADGSVEGREKKPRLRGKKAYLRCEAQLSASIRAIGAVARAVKRPCGCRVLQLCMQAYKQAKTLGEREGDALIEAGMKDATRVPVGCRRESE